MPAQGDITELLHLWRQGDRAAENELFARVLPKLRSLARYLMKGERKGHTLQSADLVGTVYMKMVRAKDRDWQNRAHFFAIAGRAMRRYLIDYARGRPDVEHIALDGVKDFLRADSDRVELAINIDQLLEKMSQVHPEWCTLVEIKYFLGLTDEEAADVLGLKVRTMQRKWRDARQWLFEQKESRHAQQSAG
jgi:RNA polymerase sigma factor (TIGR02999 family)